MGYNISETSGNSVGGGTANLDQWTFTVDFATGQGQTTVSGDFDEVPLGGGASSEASNGYTFGALNTSSFGSLAGNTTTGEFTFTIDRAAVLASGSDQTISFTVTGDDGGNSEQDTVFINLLLCVARGTRIATPDGDVPVENLARGSLVNMIDGTARRVRWIGSRRVGSHELAHAPSLRPVLIERDAFGPGQPARDLRVSPQHRILLQGWRAELLFGADEVLVPAIGLVDDARILVDHTCRDVEYFHVMFDDHQVMFTEGLPTESFHPGPYALSELDSDVRDELVTLFPHIATPAGVPETARLALRPWEGKVLTLC